MRILYISIAAIAVVLGTIGIVVPGLPTTPLILLASWCLYKSSPRLQKVLLKSFLGRYIADYEKDKSITVKKKIFIILIMASMVTLSICAFIKPITVKIIVAILGLIGCYVVGFVVKTRK